MLSIGKGEGLRGGGQGDRVSVTVQLSTMKTANFK